MITHNKFHKCTIPQPTKPGMFLTVSMVLLARQLQRMVLTVQTDRTAQMDPMTTVMTQIPIILWKY